MNEKASAPRRQRRQPRVADSVAEELRTRILSGELPDESPLPKQEELLEHFEVSLASVREALRILETEGLLTVRRGNVGGSVVRMPSASKVAYMVALVLQSRSVQLGDVAQALRLVGPLCASLAAEREDRAKHVVPVLRRRLEESREALDRPAEYVSLARQFHEDLAEVAGNATLSLMVGVLESLWSAHVARLVWQPGAFGQFEDPAVRARTFDDHTRIVDAIEAGDARRAEALASDHFSEPERYDFVVQETTVDASRLRDI